MFFSSINVSRVFRLLFIPQQLMWELIVGWPFVSLECSFGCFFFFVGKLGKLGCGSLWDIKSIPWIVAGASLLVLIGLSCVLG